MSEMFFKLWANGLIQKGIWETVYMTVLSTAFAYVLGLPLEQELYWCQPCGKNFSAPEMITGDYVGHEGLVAQLTSTKRTVNCMSAPTGKNAS